ncbi:hypothetical protein AG1IA_00900 [Rhizoctonia solani AG-1 IA]|uniref:Uncharacterized protein n=1 Tax=Thanatephorus cucumeris (strain AG1-IA) TaxID=983506 RepID=L8X8U4_THACA|nr:hypothetical protein AG1IA_00900 [Rhizoctonia solani AG-1 IA]
MHWGLPAHPRVLARVWMPQTPHLVHMCAGSLRQIRYLAIEYILRGLTIARAPKRKSLFSIVSEVMYGRAVSILDYFQLSSGHA